VTFGKYGLVVLMTAALTQAVVLPLLSGATRVAVALGAVLAVANVLAALALAAWGLKQPPKAFLAAVLGGMVARMGLVLLVVVLAVTLLAVPKLPLVFSLLGYFVPFLLLELRAFHRATPAPAGAR
jgi:hypothetical protein